jgi:hypothetical protein
MRELNQMTSFATEFANVRTASPVHCSTRSEETVEKRSRAAHPSSAEAYLGNFSPLTTSFSSGSWRATMHAGDLQGTYTQQLQRLHNTQLSKRHWEMMI